MSGDQHAKSSLREALLAEREALDAPVRAALSQAIAERVTQLECYRRCQTVLAYAGFGSEPQTETFVDRVLEDGKALLLPRVNRGERRLELYEVEDPARDLKAGTWGIREPDPDKCSRVEPAEVDFVLVPGVAFDPGGGRLGYGGGYYDRLLARRSGARPSLVAAAFELQVVEKVPLEEHDVRVNFVITERNKYTADL